MAPLLGPWRERDLQAAATPTAQGLLGLRFTEVMALEKKDIFPRTLPRVVETASTEPTSDPIGDPMSNRVCSFFVKLTMRSLFVVAVAGGCGDGGSRASSTGGTTGTSGIITSGGTTGSLGTTGMGGSSVGSGGIGSGGTTSAAGGTISNTGGNGSGGTRTSAGGNTNAGGGGSSGSGGTSSGTGGRGSGGASSPAGGNTSAGGAGSGGTVAGSGGRTGAGVVDGGAAGRVEVRPEAVRVAALESPQAAVSVRVAAGPEAVGARAAQLAPVLVAGSEARPGTVGVQAAPLRASRLAS